ncbi:M20 aminoacylase family protein [Maritimibacter sp. HL-12]|uniref:M20 aminoacylase family protein n=1 Tax=Maritimibacter sp. HL-12 TaxID=1162418 RepID=UPI000A0F22B2|nr:M20 aminoacylase family protein [Maritimibacter sp. HL-12]SMH57984.1 hippurate hydrolase [Maritimibacter sp. HL-12]
MPVINRIAAYADDMKTWRRWLHAHPELKLDCHETAAFVVEKLRDFGVDEIHEGIARSGVVAIIEGRGPGRTIGLRADMDALPMDEETGLEHASTVPGRMHACGHDGHTTMLLGAARYLAETRAFSGRVALIFQPAEEDIGGGRIMVEEGMMERFGIDEVYALHNEPGLPFGSFSTTPGPIMAAVDTFRIHIRGQGGHGAYPHEAVDPIPAALAIAQGCQTIVSRNNPPREDLVASVTMVQSGSADNVIPEKAFVGGTVRTFNPEIRDMVERRMGEIVAGSAAAYGVEAVLDYERGYPPTVNHAAEVEKAAAVARGIVGAQAVETDRPREMGAEDFSYMLDARPGAFLFLGQGEGPSVHHPKYDFNDEIAPIGASFFARLVETLQPA